MESNISPYQLYLDSLARMSPTSSYGQGGSTYQPIEEQSQSSAIMNALKGIGTNQAIKYGVNQGISALSPTATTTGWNVLGSSLPQATAANALPTAASASAAPATSTLAGLGGAGAMLGLAGAAYAGYQNFKSDGGDELLKGKTNSQRNVDAAMNSNPFTFWINPLSKMLGGRSMGSYWSGGKSTDEYKAERWGALSPELQKLYDANHSGSGIWDTGKYAGQKWSFDKALDLAKSDPTHFAGVLGNLETFGEGFTQLDADKRNALVGRLANEGFYHSNKGDVLIDKAKQDAARQIYNEIVNPQVKKPAIVLDTLSGNGQPLVIK